MSQESQAGIDPQQQLVGDIQAVISDAEEVLSATADQAGEKIANLRARVQGRLRDAKVRLSEAQAQLVEKTKGVAECTDACVRESPWTAVGIAAGVGLLLGLVLARR
ncbi:MAG: hypothetical protein A3E79_19415 [Burkholderiales bacterium RIFCSPHIGHO2_12_FULL_61_11]|nr:MAG: hypothetical protein A3E79_19415 [Burkholderiales bacterium RIFCSPHIGHO2_12_FULL_61_11]